MHTMECPDMIEFKGCQFQHDPQVKKAHQMYMTMEEGQGIQKEEKVMEILKDGIEDGWQDDDSILLKKRMLRLWPDKPTELEMLIANKKIN